jgi:CDP-L-myo-inositol myo-inositolphosphotransferase
MQAVLLAAGLGSRLGSLTANIPKALIPVGGMPLLAYAVRFAERAGARDITVVGGYGFDQVKREVESRGLRVRLVENEAFRDGNLVSLQTARPYVSGEFLLMNIDHIYRPAIAGLAGQPVDEITAFIDTDRQLGADDMKVRRETGRVKEISKTLATWDAGYVGMTKVPAAALPRYWSEADMALRDEGRAIHVERILARLAAAGEGPACRDISGHGWLEVDLPEERAHAEEALKRGSW